MSKQGRSIDEDSRRDSNPPVDELSQATGQEKEETDALPPERPETDYQVGYRRPPRASRFQKGRSGNPRGRKKGSRNLDQIVQQVAKETVTVVHKGKSIKMPADEVLIRKVSADALQGDPKAREQMLQLLKEYSPADTTLPPGQIDNAEDHNLIAQALERMAIDKP